MDDEFLNDYRKAAEVHRQVRQYVQTIAKPGVSMNQLAQEIEDGVRALTNHQGLETGDALKAGMGFPTGLCLNNVAAHWTPNPGAKEVILQYDDLLKVVSEFMSAAGLSIAPLPWLSIRPTIICSRLSRQPPILGSR
jgi:methionyl aminopeptidase